MFLDSDDPVALDGISAAAGLSAPKTLQPGAPRHASARPPVRASACPRVGLSGCSFFVQVLAPSRAVLSEALATIFDRS
jgi:hypothetical protein